MNPKVTLMVFNQPPDLGNFSRTLGNIANKANGKPRANPNPPIPAVNSQAPESPVNDPANKVPKIGPVQEKDTIAKVSAMKNIPIIPAADSFLDDLLTQEEGRVNS